MFFPLILLIQPLFVVLQSGAVSDDVSSQLPAQENQQEAGEKNDDQSEKADRADDDESDGFAAAVELLDALEKSAEDLTDFQATLLYRKEDPLGDPEQFFGSIAYAVDRAEDRTRFAILFTRHMIGNHARDRDHQYIFDGTWLAEINHQDRQFIKMQVVAPGEKFDPLKLGEGPFPLPIGQPREEVLARFEAELIGPPEEGFLAGKIAAHIHGLQLTPREGTAEAEEFARVRIYYDRVTLLPIGVDALLLNGGRKLVLLRDQKRDRGIDPAVLRIPEAPPGYRVEVRPYRGGEDS